MHLRVSAGCLFREIFQAIHFVLTFGKEQWPHPQRSIIKVLVTKK